MVIAPAIAEALAGATVPALCALKQRFGREVTIQGDTTFDRFRFQIVPV